MINELKQLKQWIMWRYETIDGKETKVPYSPLDGYKVGTSLSKDKDCMKRWATFEQAKQTQMKVWASGVGFVLTGKPNIICIDLDDCIVDGEILAHAKSYMSLFNTYTEVSPSGQGLRLIALATEVIPNRRASQIEIYSHDRYMTYTGNVVLDLSIRDCTKELLETIESFPAKQVIVFLKEV